VPKTATILYPVSSLKVQSACKVDHLLQSWPTANPFTTTADWFELSMGVSDNGVYPLMASENGKNIINQAIWGKNSTFGQTPSC